MQSLINLRLNIVDKLNILVPRKSEKYSEGHMKVYQKLKKQA